MPPPRAIEWSVYFKGTTSTAADLDDSKGDVSFSRVGAGLSVGIPIGQRSQLDINPEYELLIYDFHNTGTLLPTAGEPWGEIHRQSLSARLATQVDQRLRWYLGGSVTGSAEDGADWNEGLTFGVLGGVAYALSETLQVGGGIAITTQIEEDPLPVPVLTVNWQFAERWRLSNERRLGLGVFYEPDEMWKFGVIASYERNEFRLDDSGPLPDGVGRDRRVPIAAVVSIKPSASVRIDAEAGVYVFQEYKFEDEGGNEIAESDADPAAFISIRLTYSF